MKSCKGGYSTGPRETIRVTLHIRCSKCMISGIKCDKPNVSSLERTYRYSRVVWRTRAGEVLLSNCLAPPLRGLLMTWRGLRTPIVSRPSAAPFSVLTISITKSSTEGAATTPPYTRSPKLPMRHLIRW